MDKHQRFLQAYNYLYERGIIHTQKDLAVALKSSPANVSTMVRTGNSKVLTDNIMVRLSNTYPGTFNVDWLLNGNGEMLINHGTDPTGFVADAPKEQQNDALAFASAQLAQLANKLIDSLANVDRREKQLNELIARLQNQEHQLNDLITRLSGYEQLIKSRVANNPILGTGTSHFFEDHQVSDIEIVSESPVLSETHKNTH